MVGTFMQTDYYTNVNKYPTKQDLQNLVAQITVIPGCEDYNTDKAYAYFAGKRQQNGDTRAKIKKQGRAQQQPNQPQPPTSAEIREYSRSHNHSGAPAHGTRLRSISDASERDVRVGEVGRAPHRNTTSNGRCREDMGDADRQRSVAGGYQDVCGLETSTKAFRRCEPLIANTRDETLMVL